MGMFVWFVMKPGAVFLGFRVFVIANIKVRDIVTRNRYMLPWGLFANVRVAVVAGVAGVAMVWVSSKRLCWKGFQFQPVGVTRMCVGDGGNIGGGNELVIVLGCAGGQKVMMPNIGIVARTRRMATASVNVIAITAR